MNGPPLLPDATAVAFEDLEPALARHNRTIGSGRALTAPVAMSSGADQVRPPSVERE